MASKERLLKRWSNFKQPELENLSCYVCKYYGNIATFKTHKCMDQFHAGELTRYECPRCEVIFGDLRFLQLSRKEISEDYCDLYSFYNEGDTTKYILEVLTRTQLLKPSYTYLDFACGSWNKIIPFLREKNFQIEGYDKHIDKYNKRPTQLFDIVYCSNYIEHLIDPYPDIQEMLDFLKPDGKLVLISPCFEYCIADTHYHTFFFREKALKILCETLNIELLDSEKIYFSDGDKTIVKVFTKK